jgi:CDP-paratose 2-epimerase
MSTAIVTGATGLVGAEVVRLFHAEGMDVVGIDNDMRRQFFSGVAPDDAIRKELSSSLKRYVHSDHDIRDEEALDALFARYGRNISVVVHTAAQPSHDWAAQNPLVDFSVNATGTLVLLEAARKHCPEAAFVFCSTNKVYGARPNELPLLEQQTRWEIETRHSYFERGIPEDMSIDRTMHSLFGVSKAAADLMVQEYGVYFGMKTAVFRAGCITGSRHRGTKQHGFLAFLANCVASGQTYEVIGYGGKQVRDNIHAHDLASAFLEFSRNPRNGEVYNIGGGRERSCSVLEAIESFQQSFGRKLQWRYNPQSRAGDHIWWISDISKFRGHYPGWQLQYSLEDIVADFASAYRQNI